jgi:prolyl-tRNA editing enzyme YbaK/EbsC (Cys-tRNA(Pro) deacylase)
MKIKKVVKKQIKVLKNDITKLLDAAKIKYNLIEHRVVYTAHDVSATTKKKLGEIAKVVLVRVKGAPSLVIASQPSKRKGEAISTKKKINSGRQSPALIMTKPSDYFALIVLPAGKYVDFNGIKKALKAKKVSMASEKDIIKHLKTKVGLLHPFGIEYNMKTLVDKGLAKSKKLMTSAGSYTHSVEIAMKDFEKLITPIKGAFAKNKR